MANYNTTAAGCGCNSNSSAQARPQPCVRPMAKTAMQQPCCSGRMPDPIEHMPLAMAYVPWQYFQDVYEPDKALMYGTIFPELNKPFYGKGGCMR